jgi:hypothetical protein
MSAVAAGTRPGAGAPPPALEETAPPGRREPARWLRAAILLAAYAALAALLIGWSHDRATPFGFVDELVYGRLAQNLGHGDGLTYQGLAVSAYKTLYPFLIAPAWALFADHADAYHAALALNALVMPLAALPAYAIARRVAPFGWAVVAALAAGLTPAMAWSSLLMTESLAYPLAALAFWAAVVAVARPGPGTAALALVAAAAGATARTQMLVLLPVLGLAVALDVARFGRGWRARARAHRWLLGAFALGALGALGVLLLGYRDALLGTYSGELDRGVQLAELVGYLPRYLPVIAVSTLLVPFLALVALATTRRGWADPALGPVLAVAVAAVVVFVLVGAWASATISPELRERYVFYPAAILPAVWVALWSRRERLRLALATIAAFLVLAPVVRAIYGDASAEWVSYTVRSLLDAYPIPGPLPPAWLGGELTFWSVAALGMGAVTVWALSGTRRRRLAVAAFAVPPLLFGFGITSLREYDLRAQARVQEALHVRPFDIVDRLAGGEAAFVRTPGTELRDIWHLELWNRELDRVWRVPGVEPESSVGQACALVAAPGGRLVPREPCAGRDLPRTLVFDDDRHRVEVLGGRRRFAREGVSVWELEPGAPLRIRLAPLRR